MKKVIILLSILVSAFVLASCANKGTTADQNANAMSAQTSGASSHHDYKGETK